MRDTLLAFANEYDAEMDSQGSDADELRSINHPLVFLFLGDQTEEALRQIRKLNGNQWNNSEGVVYLHVGTKPVEPDENLYSWALPALSDDKKSSYEHARAVLQR